MDYFRKTGIILPIPAAALERHVREAQRIRHHKVKLVFDARDVKHYLAGVVAAIKLSLQRRPCADLIRPGVGCDAPELYVAPGQRARPEPVCLCVVQVYTSLEHLAGRLDFLHQQC